MHRMLRTYGFIISLSLIGFVAFGQSFTATVNTNTVTVGQQFRLTYTLNAVGENFRLPQLRDFRILSGPNESNSTQIVNGRVSRSISLSYVLAATKVGKYTIPAGVVSVNGNDISSNSIQIEVLPPSEAQLQQKRQEEQRKQQEQKQLQENLFVKLLISKNKTYQGDQLIATYKIYTRLNVVHYQVDKWPAFNGFYSQEVDLGGKNQSKNEIINGVQYTTAILRQMVLSPQKSGKLTIPPLEMKVVVRVADERPSRSIFDMFNSYKDVEINLKSNAANINVKPLPSKGRTPEYNGAVGNFNLKTSVDKQEVKVNDAINYKITFSGTGGIKLIKDPVLELPPDFEVFDPKENTKVKTSQSGVSGTKTYEYLIIPRHSGEFKIPSIRFTYFDPAKGSYQTLTTEEFNIIVAKSNGSNEEGGATTVRPVRKKDVALLGKDIRYINTDNLKLYEVGSVFFGSRLFWILLLVPFFLFIGLLIIRKRIKELQSDVIGMNKRKAGKVASKHLSTAKKHLAEGNKNEFYEEVHRSLYQYMAMKLNIPVAQLDTDFIKTKLTENKVSEAKTQAFLDILGECEMARYAPSAAMDEASLFDKTTQCINQLEEEIK